MRYKGVLQWPKGIAAKDNPPTQEFWLVSSESTEIVTTVPDPDLLVSFKTSPVAVAVTGDAESELKAAAKAAAMPPVEPPPP